MSPSQAHSRRTRWPLARHRRGAGSQRRGGRRALWLQQQRGAALDPRPATPVLARRGRAEGAGGRRQHVGQRVAAAGRPGCGRRGRLQQAAPGMVIVEAARSSPRAARGRSRSAVCVVGAAGAAGAAGRAGLRALVRVLRCRAALLRCRLLQDAQDLGARAAAAEDGRGPVAGLTQWKLLV